jgi:hypothetical protein
MPRERFAAIGIARLRYQPGATATSDEAVVRASGVPDPTDDLAIAPQRHAETSQTGEVAHCIRRVTPIERQRDQSGSEAVSSARARHPPGALPPLRCRRWQRGYPDQRDHRIPSA